MAWVRLDDNYVQHPKFLALSHVAFRLWHEGMCYCRKLMTDGVIPATDLKTFRYAQRAAIQELTTPRAPGGAALWLHAEGGYLIHDYLDWNPSQTDEQKERDAAKKRMRAYRGKNTSGSSPPVTPPVTPFVTPSVTPHVLGQGQGRVLRKEERLEKCADVPTATPIEMRAGALLTRYAELFYEHRKGARYHNRMHLDFPKACELVQTWPDDARLERLAVIVLTTDDEWISATDRGFGIFAARASWADDRLTAWEARTGVGA